ncbi:unnamed protein product [Lactuca saligna]|uniref:Uncharacterized protein n=1 Tax=Lactuca saligna TaxID=75948 RepID=A0AA35Y7Y5_LACSI|nr:unnamed protein product [Lactuca saligna]
MECNLAESSWQMGIYDDSEMKTPTFDIFFRIVVRECLPGVSGYDFWESIAKGAFHSGVSKESHIQSPIHKLLHRLVTFSINYKKHGDKMTTLNLFFLWTVTCKAGNDLSTGYLEPMHVFVNMGSHWSMHVDNYGEKIGQPEQQPHLRGRRNVHGRGDRGQPMHQNAPMEGAPLGEETMAGYFDQMSLSKKWIGGTMMNMIRDFNVTQPPHLGDRYQVCST